MTDLYNGRMVDLLQNQLSSNPEAEALSYAVLQEKRRIMDEARQTRTMAVIDELPEEILDVLSVEIPSPYYRQDMTVEQKREIVKGSLRWFTKAGTAAALSEMTAVIFGSGGVMEWFNFDPNDGEIVPGEFDLETGAEMQDPTDFMVEINRIIGRIKNVRSRLRNVRFLRIIHAPETPKVLPEKYTIRPIQNMRDLSGEIAQRLSIAALALSVAEVTIGNAVSLASDAAAAPSAAAASTAHGEVTIGNAASTEGSVSAKPSGGNLTQSYSAAAII